MADKHRHPYAGRADPQFIEAHNLPCLEDHLVLFLGEAVVLENIDLRNGVKGQAPREFPRSLGCLKLSRSTV